MPVIEVDGRKFEVEQGQNLLHACLSHKLDLPYFCWHPAMGSVGACRQCAVIQYQDENDERGRLVMACMTPVADGARLSIEAAHAVEFRASVIEWLMENHPHDCPVCEEGGECHLQDMTVMTGHTSRRYRGGKRTFKNQYLGPFIGHEMNRCITCYRCVRYYQDYAGGDDLQAFGSRDRMFFGRAEDGVLENEFAGNLVEVCPTGVFTDKPFSQTYTRKWDLQSAPSICTGCAVGCNTMPGERYGVLKRVHNRYHPELNGYFLCDRGRFGSGYVNSEQRLRRAGTRAADGVFEEITAETAAGRLADVLSSGGVIGIGSPRASLENNQALKRLVGDENFSTGVSAAQAELDALMLSIHQAGGARIASIADVEAADAVLVLGEDVLNTAPRAALALRQAVRNLSMDMAAGAGIPTWQDAGVRGHAQHARNPLLIASMAPTRVDDIASATWRAEPESIAAAGFAIAHRIDDGFAAESGGPAFDSPFVEQAVAALAAAEKPLIVSGAGCASREVLEAAANVAWALAGQGKDCALLLAGAEANSMGVTLLGGGISLETALDRVAAGEAGSLIVLENDLFRRVEVDAAAAALDSAEHVVVLDVLETRTAERASLAIPAAAVTESTGTLVNCEGRAQRFYQVFEPEDPVRPSWRWLADAAISAGRNDLRWKHIDEVTRACAELPGLAGTAEVTPPADYRTTAGMRIPRMTHRASGRTAKDAHVSVHEPKATVDDQTPLSYSMEGLNADQPGGLLPYVWSPGWNSNQSVFKFQQEVAGPLGDSGTGVLLIDQDEPADLPARFRDAPQAVPAGDGLRLLPLHRVFGSDELSAFASPIEERGAGPEVLVHPDDAEAFSIESGKGARCGDIGSFAVRLDDGMPKGCAGIVVGLKNSAAGLPAFGSLTPDPDFVAKPEVIARG